MKKIDGITKFNNGVWSTDLPGSGIAVPKELKDHWSISPSGGWLTDVKEQKLDMIRLKLNEIIEAINTEKEQKV
jgi:hypothetical protein